MRPSQACRPAPRQGVPAIVLAVVLATVLPMAVGRSTAQSPAVALPKDPPFVPPTAEALAKVVWTPRPCVDYMEHLRRTLERSPPEVSEAEALALDNTDDAANRKILSALGRLPRSDEEVDWDATFNRFIGGEPRTLNPLFSSSRYEFWVEDLLWVGPVQFDWNLECLGDLDVIERWETSEDRLMDRVLLRRDLVWTDGRPVTAHDVEFTWKLLVDPRIRVEARRTMVQGLRAVKAYDDRTVVYFHREAFATNHLQLVWPILPKHAFERELAKDPSLERCALNKEPVTCGPYRLTLWRPNQEIVFERRDEWFLGASGERIRRKPFMRQVRFRIIPQNAPRFLAFLAGDTDDTQLDSAQWTTDSAGRGFRDRGVKVRGDEWTYVYVGWNARSVPPNPFFADPRVRWAMTLAFDHDFLLKEMFYGIYRAGVGIFHPDSWMAAKGLGPVHKDLARAEKLLDEAGWKDSDGDGIRDKTIDGKKVDLGFKLSCPNAGSGPRVVKQFQDDLRLVGVDCRADLIEWNAFQEALANRQLQAFAMAMGAGVDPDTARNLWTTKAIEEGRNQVGFSDPRIDALLEEGRRELDQAKRAAIYAQVDRIIYEEQPISILLYQPTLWGFAKSVRGYRPSPKGFFGVAPGFQSIWKAR